MATSRGLIKKYDLEYTAEDVVLDLLQYLIDDDPSLEAKLDLLIAP
jgi:hypothetical protein